MNFWKCEDKFIVAQLFPFYNKLKASCLVFNQSTQKLEIKEIVNKLCEASYALNNPCELFSLHIHYNMTMPVNICSHKLIVEHEDGYQGTDCFVLPYLPIEELLIKVECTSPKEHEQQQQINDFITASSILYDPDDPLY